MTTFAGALSIELARLDATTAKLAALDARIAAATDPDVAAEYRHYRDRIVSRA